ncbi:hypothetical protein MBLNU459_g0613t1 [Dothideomycetes sp. NU459]
MQITVENCTRILQYEEQYKVIICREHGYAVRNLARHLRESHLGKAKDKQQVVRMFSDCEVADPREVLVPPPLEAPIEALGKPRLAFLCEEDECNYISTNRSEMGKHCNKKHNWKSTKGDLEHWHQVYVQTFFSAGGFQKYFTVDWNERDQTQQSRSTLRYEDEVDILSIEEDWNIAKQERAKQLEIIDGEIAKQDHTLWFKQTGWVEHLAKSNLKHLAYASRLPDKDEQILQKVAQMTDTLLEKCVSGLPTLDKETRRWLRSAKRNEPDVRPIARLQNKDSQFRYSGYWKRFVCYCLRVYAEQKRREDRGSEGENDDSRNSDRGDDSRNSDRGDDSDEEGSLYSESAAEEQGDKRQRNNNTRQTDVMFDACRLFPWKADQKSRAERLWRSVEAKEDEKQQLDSMLELFTSFIFQPVRGDVFVGGLMHFLAVLAIDEETERLRQANDFSYLLAGVVYCIRMFAIEAILPSAARQYQDETDDGRFLVEREKFLADGSYSPMSKMISMLAYSKKLALNHGNAGSISWNGEGTTIQLRGRPIVISQFKRMISDVITEAETLLWSKLMWTGRDERFEMPLMDMEDDVTWTKRGVSFVNNTRNNLQDGHQWMLKKAKSSEGGRKLRVNGVWQVRKVRRYLREVDKFMELLLFCVHLTGGQPARGTEITSVRFRNGFLQDRNIFVIHGSMVTITRYHKSQSQYDTPKVIPRFLPWRVGQILAVYLSYIQPFQELLAVQTTGSAGWSDYLWAGKQGPWETDRLTKVISRETQKHLGNKLTTHDYRHGAIAIGRRFVGQEFARGYNEEIGEVEEAEADEDDPLELSAGRGSAVGSRRYGVSVDIVKHLSSRSIDTFRSLSERWHDFLGLSSYGGKGKKRVRDGVGAEDGEEDRTHGSEGRSVKGRRRVIGNNIIWDLSRVRAAVQQQKEHPEMTTRQEGLEDDGWFPEWNKLDVYDPGDAAMALGRQSDGAVNSFMDYSIRGGVVFAER